MGLLSNWLRNKRTNFVDPYLKGVVLDLGCGPARNLELAGDRISRYYGVERDESVVEELIKKYPRARFFQKNLDEDLLDFETKFDNILLIAVVEHIFNQKHLFSEVVKCLKPNGKIIVTTPTPFGNDVVHKLGSLIGLFSKKGGQDDHIIIYNKKRFNILAREFNLKIEKYKKFELGCNQLVILSKK